MKAIAMFNNKGGVGKTTLVCNLASFLAKNFRKKILLIDADPQCNSSSYVLSEEEFYAAYYSRKIPTIYELLLPLSRGEGYSGKLKPSHAAPFGFDILIGSPKLAMMEDLLAADWSDVQGGRARGTRTTLVFDKALTEYQDYDFVFFDMGPSLGGINRAILIASDYFMTPMSSDIFSVLALENIGASIETWRSIFDDGIKKLKSIDAGALEGLKDSFSIKFLGYVTQQYIAKSVQGSRVPVKAYEKIIQSIPKSIQKNIVSKINVEVQKKSIDYLLGTIPMFNSLIPMSQNSHTPIFSLTSKDGVRGSHFSNVKYYTEIINEVAINFTKNIESI